MQSQNVILDSVRFWC